MNKLREAVHEYLNLGRAVTSPFVRWFLFQLIGSVVEYLAWTVGFGAVALTRFSRVSVAPVNSSSA